MTRPASIDPRQLRKRRFLAEQARAFAETFATAINEMHDARRQLTGPPIHPEPVSGRGPAHAQQNGVGPMSRSFHAAEIAGD